MLTIATAFLFAVMAEYGVQWAGVTATWPISVVLDACLIGFWIYTWGERGK